MILIRNILIIIFCLIFSTFIFSQDKSESIQINWHSNAFKSENNQIPSFYFEEAKSMGSSGLVPHYYTEIILEEFETIGKIEITNIIEDSYPIDSELYHIIESELSENYSIHYEIDKRNGTRIAKVHFPCISTGTIPLVLNRLQSFNLNYTTELTDKTSNEISFPQFTQESAFRTGEWHQFKLNKSGVYKLTYEQITSSGISISAFPASNIRMFGFGGTLSELNNDFRHADIPEIAIKMVDGGDDSFDAGDYILFYGQGPDTWHYSDEDEVFHHKINIYSRSSYYYLVLGEEAGLRINTLNSSQNSNYTTNTFIDYDVKEDETYNLINSGRRWFGDKFEFQTDYQYLFNFSNIKSGSPVSLKAVFAARSVVSSRFTVSMFDESKSVSIAALSSGSYASYAKGGEITWELEASSSSSSVTVDVNYNQPLSGSIGWLDFIEINVERKLIYSDGQMHFRDPRTVKPARITDFNIQNNSGSNPILWDVTNPDHPTKISYNGSSDISFLLPTTDLKEFIIYKEASAYRADFVKAVPNQNLHAEINHEYIIITHPNFLDQANELADFHREESHMDVFVTTLEPIYHEFSSGKQDVSAIRDFIRCVYDNSDNDKRLKYLLFFGDASMDYLNRVENNTNMVPTWETYESFDPIKSIATDDFFGFLDENEGDMIYDEVNIGMGRFPVATVAEAQQMVDKVKHYKSNDVKVMADWRNIICFIADDEDNNTHIGQADDLSILVDSIYPTANLDKIYVDAYIQESTPAGQRYSKVNEAINERVDKGALIISYTGHGGEVGWGQERYLDLPDIESWTNYDNLPVFLTATCEFARFDDPARTSAGELVFLNPRGGGISLFTTTRATYASSNFTVSTNFYKNALKQTNGSYPTMGEILKKTKLASGSGTNVMKFILLGDPALKMNIPKKEVLVTSIINNGLESETDTINALSNITVKGMVTDENENIISNFNGSVYPTIFDKPVTISTLGNDSDSPIFDFELQKNILYKGEADIVNGEFEFTFIVPKDIAYKYGNGKISLYASNGEIDASGYDKEIIIGGYDENFSEDNEGPEIDLYINNTNFVPGGTTNENPVLLAFVTDESGINTTGNGIGHDISATLDGDPNYVKILNNYYISDANSYKSGAISFPFFSVSDGHHTLEFKVWDIHNNSSKASINFVVASSGTMALEELFNYPNPVIDYTTFSFEHNQSGEELEVLIDIYGIDGKLVTRIQEDFMADGYRNNQITWDVTDQNGSKLAKGVYIYKLLLRSGDGIEATKSSRLVVIK